MRAADACHVLLLLLLLGFFSAALASAPSSFPQQAHAETLGTWTPTSAYVDATGATSCVVTGGYVYCIGGYTSSSNSYFATVSSSGIGSWTSTTSYPITFAQGGIINTSCVTFSGYIYCVGGHTLGSASGAIASVYFATVSTSGIGKWVATTDYPLATNSLSCAVAGGYIYCVGGALNSPYVSDAVYYAQISSSGVGQWLATRSYPIPIYTETCAITGGYMYCIGGDTQQSSGLISGTDAVYYAPISSSGVGAWTATTAYPSSTGGQVCGISSYGYVYCVGGYQSGSIGLTSAYYSPTSPAGVGPWVATTSFPMGFSSSIGGACPISGNYIYCIVSASYGKFSYYAAISPPPTSSLLVVDTVNMSDEAISGFYTVLYQSGTLVSSAFSPATLTLTNGETYVVQADDYGACHFDHWADTGGTSASRPISIEGDSQITAVYNCGGMSSSSVTVGSVDQSGDALFGYYTAILDPSGNLVASGFTTKTFSTTSGESYSLQADSYGSCTFTKWSDGVTSDPRTVIASSGALSFIAAYTCGAGGSSTIEVSTVNSMGAPIPGYYVTLWQNGSQLQNCFSPCSFTVSDGQTYRVVAESFGGESFSHWQNDGEAGAETVIVPSGGGTTALTAVYSP
jgi:hypothetical protein